MSRRFGALGRESVPREKSAFRKQERKSLREQGSAVHFPDFRRKRASPKQTMIEKEGRGPLRSKDPTRREWDEGPWEDPETK